MRAFLPLAILGFSGLVCAVSAQSTSSTAPVVADVLKLSQANVDEGVILAYVQQAPRGNVSAADLVELHSNGISSRVLVALLNSHPPVDAAQLPAQANASPPPSDETAVGTAPVYSPAVVEAPLVDYVSAPVYVGGGSIYYHDDWWWGVGWGWGWGWSCWYPWYGWGWYSYCGHSGYYAHGGHHHHSTDFDGDHGHGGHHNNNGHGGQWAGHTSVGRSTLAGAGVNSSRGAATSPAGHSVSAGGTPRSQPAANRVSNATGNLGSRNTGNASTATSRGAAAPVGNTMGRSATAGRATTASVGQNSGTRPTGTALGGAGQPSSTMVSRNVVASTRSAPSPANTVAPRAVGNSTMRPVYSGGAQTSRSTYASVGGSYAAPRSFSAPSMGSYSAGRSYSGSAHMGGFSGGGSGYHGGGFSGGGHSGGFGGGGRR